MYAYSELYLEDAMNHLGEMLDYAVHDLKYEIGEIWQMFISSGIGQQFQKGNPKYVAGMSGIELAMEVIHEKTGQWVKTKPTVTEDCTPEYWTGWILAYYQHKKNMEFERLAELGISAENVIDMYLFHEVDEEKFAMRADEIIELSITSEENRLKRLRKYAELTQAQLAEKSGVSLRMIQLYEQGRNDLGKAQASVVLALAQVLNCEPRDII